MLFHIINVLLCAFFIEAASIEKRQIRGSLQQVTNWGNNPTNTGFYIYVPNKLATKPGIIVASHHCQGSAQLTYQNTPYKTYAEQYGFIVIYPHSPHQGTCWDISSKATLTHNGGGDSNAIVNMVSWTVKQFQADQNKIFATGGSSGGMMTTVLAAAYPDVFKAAVVYAGVAAGCFVSASNQVAAWNSTCAQGTSINSPEVWARVARNMYPGYSGSYPRMQIYHGGADTTVRPQNYYESCKQWASVWGYNYNAPQSKQENSPTSWWTRTVFGPNVHGLFNPSTGHGVPNFGAEEMKWFGFSS